MMNEKTSEANLLWIVFFTWSDSRDRVAGVRGCRSVFVVVFLCESFDLRHGDGYGIQVETVIGTTKDERGDEALILLRPFLHGVVGTVLTRICGRVE